MSSSGWVWGPFFNPQDFLESSASFCCVLPLGGPAGISEGVFFPTHLHVGAEVLGGVDGWVVITEDWDFVPGTAHFFAGAVIGRRTCYEAVACLF
jgi:hypothetical protein